MKRKVMMFGLLASLAVSSLAIAVTRSGADNASSQNSSCCVAGAACCTGNGACCQAAGRQAGSTCSSGATN